MKQAFRVIYTFDILSKMAGIQPQGMFVVLLSPKELTSKQGMYSERQTRYNRAKFKSVQTNQMNNLNTTLFKQMIRKEQTFKPSSLQLNKEAPSY